MIRRLPSPPCSLLRGSAWGKYDLLGCPIPSPPWTCLTNTFTKSTNLFAVWPFVIISAAKINIGIAKSTKDEIPFIVCCITAIGFMLGKNKDIVSIDVKLMVINIGNPKAKISAIAVPINNNIYISPF